LLGGDSLSKGSVNGTVQSAAFDGKLDAEKLTNSLKSPEVLLCFDHVPASVVNTNHSIV